MFILFIELEFIFVKRGWEPLSFMPEKSVKNGVGFFSQLKEDISSKNNKNFLKTFKFWYKVERGYYINFIFNYTIKLFLN